MQNAKFKTAFIEAPLINIANLLKIGNVGQALTA